MQKEAQNTMVQPPSILQAVSKVEQAVARLQELQCSFAKSHLATQSKLNSPSCRMPDLVEFSPSKKSTLERRVSGEFKKLSRSKAFLESTEEERRKSLKLPDEWRHWSSQANDVHNVLSEIMLASQFAKQFVNIVGSRSLYHQESANINPSKSILQPAKKSSAEIHPDTDTPQRTEPKFPMIASVAVNLFNGDSSRLAASEAVVNTSIENLEATPLPTSRMAQLNKRSSSKRYSTRKPPPHLFKVVIASEGPAARTESDTRLRQLEARKLATPSPLYKRRSGTLVQKPTPSTSELRSSSTSIDVVIRSSLEKKPRVQNSLSIRGSTERFVEACRALMEEEAQLNCSTGESSTSPPLVIKPLSLDSPADALKVKASSKTNNNWLTNRFMKTSSQPSAAHTSKLWQKSYRSKNLPTLISRLPAQKLEKAAVPAEIPSKVTEPLVKSSNSGVLESLPLPPARHADNALRTSTAGMAMKVSKDKRSGLTSYALAPVSMPGRSKELNAIDSNSMREREKTKCSGGCPVKDPNAHSKGRTSSDTGTGIETSIPSYMRPKSGGGSRKENIALRTSSAGLNQKSSTIKNASGTSFLHRAKDWVSLHKARDKGGRTIPEPSQKSAMAR